MSRDGFIPGHIPTHSSIYLGLNIRSIEFDEETMGLIFGHTWESTNEYTNNKMEIRSIMCISHCAYLIVRDMETHFLELFGNCGLDFTFDFFLT